MFVDIIAFSCCFGSGSVHMKQQQWYPHPYLEHDSLQVCPQSCISIGSAVSAGLTVIINTLTDEQTTTALNIRYNTRCYIERVLKS